MLLAIDTDWNVALNGITLLLGTIAASYFAYKTAVIQSSATAAAATAKATAGHMTEVKTLVNGNQTRMDERHAKLEDRHAQLEDKFDALTAELKKALEDKARLESEAKDK